MRGVGQEGRLFAPVRTAEDERVLLEDLLLRLIDNDRVHAHKRALLLQESSSLPPSLSLSFFFLCFVFFSRFFFYVFLFFAVGPLLSRCGLPAKAHRAGRRRRSADDEDDDNKDDDNKDDNNSVNNNNNKKRKKKSSTGTGSSVGEKRRTVLSADETALLTRLAASGRAKTVQDLYAAVPAVAKMPVKRLGGELKLAGVWVPKTEKKPKKQESKDQ